MKKERLLSIISDLPQSFDLEVLMEKLLFIEKVEKGLEQLNSGNTLTHQQVKQRVREWSK
jgi:predicted transcriptional regulator